MADKDQNDEFEDEFEFETEEIFDDETQDSSESSTAPVAERKRSNFPWLIALLVLGIAGYFGWQFYQAGAGGEIGEITSPPPEQVAQPQVLEEETAPFAQLPVQESLDQQLDAIEQPLPPPLVVVKEEKSSAQIDRVVSETKEDFEKSVGSLKKEIDSITKSNSTKINEIEKDLQLTAGKIVNVDRNLGLIQQDISQLTQVVKALTEQVAELQAARQAIKADAADRARRSGQAAAGSTQKAPHVSQTMTIHAIIPGRAWIRTQDGKTLSVAEGDMLGQFGKVLKIDAATGSVLTSSGATIR